MRQAMFDEHVKVEARAHVVNHRVEFKLIDLCPIARKHEQTVEHAEFEQVGGVEVFAQHCP